jgi:hypothetical protein
MNQSLLAAEILPGLIARKIVDLARPMAHRGCFGTAAKVRSHHTYQEPFLIRCRLPKIGGDIGERRIEN